MKVLVTGGTGFIGSHLIEHLLAKDCEIRTIAKDEQNMPESNSQKIEVILADLNGKEDWSHVFDGVEMVYHLAGLTRAKVAREYYQGNYLATKRFVRLCKKHCPHLKRFVYVSSLAATGPCNGKIVDETSDYHPVSDYGKSKMLAEKEVLKAGKTMPIVIVRPSAVYGPRDRDMYEYFKLIRQGVHPVIGFGKKHLNLIHVEDLVRGIILAGESKKASNQIIFLGSEQAYTNEQIGNAIARVLSCSPLRIRIPHSLIYFIGATAQFFGMITGKQIFFNIQKAKEAVQSNWDCSVAKARDLLGFRPEIPLLDGMQQTYKWYKQHHWL